MNCTDEAVGLLLANYYTGELPLGDRLRVESHVAHCEDCRKSLALIMTVGGQSPEAYRSDHLSPELLSQYFQKQSEWPKEEAEQIRQHLESCDNCRREYSFLTGLESELEAAAADHTVTTKIVRPPLIWQTMKQLLAMPAFAWVIVLLTAYPTVNWLMDRAGPDTQDLATEIVGPVHELLEARRGLEGSVEVGRNADEQFLRFVIPMYTIPTQMSYRFSFMLSETDKRVETQVIANLQEAGKIVLLVDATALIDGVYELKIVETDKETKEIESERAFSFELFTRP